jgi:hypothetical protein
MSAKDVLANFDKFDKNIRQEMVYGAQAVQAKLINEAKAACPVGVSSALQASIQAGPIIITDDNIDAFVEANADYASFIEFGTRPHFPPVDALRDWAAKFLGDERLAFLVARAISRRGTLAHPFLGPALIANMPVFVQAMTAAVQRGLAGR